jgi:hypothetical protein
MRPHRPRRDAGAPSPCQFGGDGTFPVFAEVDEDGSVVRVTVEFVEPEEDE